MSILERVTARVEDSVTSLDAMLGKDDGAMDEPKDDTDDILASLAAGDDDGAKDNAKDDTDDILASLAAGDDGSKNDDAAALALLESLENGSFVLGHGAWFVVSPCIY